MQIEYQTIFIIGAPRSGTNILRDCLSASPAVATWPCDEINYIWKYGNATYPTDQVKVTQLSPKIKTYIQNQFEKLAKQTGSRFVLEKTCANCLRVDYLSAIFPNAKYVYIYRDGVDCTASAVKRWKAEFDLNYTLKKVKYVPIADLPYYFFKFLKNRISKLFSKEKRLAYWGPSFDGMNKLLSESDSTIISAHQWDQCNSLAVDGLEKIDAANIHKINYSQLAEAPQEVIRGITKFMRLEQTESQPIIDYANANVRRSSVGKGYAEIDAAKLTEVKAIISSTMQRLGLKIKSE